MAASPAPAAAPAPAVAAQVVSTGRTQPNLDVCMSAQAAIRCAISSTIEDLNLSSRSLVELAEMGSEVEEAAEANVRRLQAHGIISAADDVDTLVSGVKTALTDFGVFLDLVTDEEIQEIVITHTGTILADREGQLGDSGSRIDDSARITKMIEVLGLLGGASATDFSPLIDVRLHEGARVVAATPPASFRGPTMTFRKDSREAFSLEDLVQADGLNENMQAFLDYCIRYRKGTMLCLGPGVSGSATLNAIGSLLSPEERVVTIEANVELMLPDHQNIVALQSNASQTVSDLAGFATALQPDRCLIGAVSGGADVRAVVEAMDGPLEGASFAYAASTPEEAIARVLNSELASTGLSVAEAGAMLSTAVSIVLQEQRFADGSRRITRICELSTSGG